MAEARKTYQTGPWSTPDIISAALVGPVVVAAFLESFLWVAAFLYCFGKAFKKSDHWTQKMLAVWFSVLFIILRQDFWSVPRISL